MHLLLPLLKRSLTGLLLLIPQFAFALNGVFYQPQLRDMDIPMERWHSIFSEVKAHQFDTLVVQWSQYGDAFESEAQQAWLEKVVGLAAHRGLNIIMGLYADPGQFQEIKASNSLIEPYFLEVKEKNVRLATHWLKTLPSNRLKGWYLTFEVDDQRWRDRNDMTWLGHQVRRDVQAVTTLEPGLPVYLSTFFGGYTTPANYRDLLSDLAHASGAKLWVQDGRGTRRLLPVETGIYIQALSNCDNSPVAGWIIEAFQQTGSSEAFTARPLKGTALKKALAQKIPCGQDRLVFSLRYLIDLSNEKSIQKH